MKNKVKIKYQTDENDIMWGWEVGAISPWLFGKGADVGCGLRSAMEGSIRVDIDPKVKPEIVASGDKLPFKDGELDFISSIHSFEHFADQKKLLKEWLRVVRVGGIIAIVHPDINHTKKQNPMIDNPGLKANPFNKHYFEHNKKSLLKKLKGFSELQFRIIDHGVACEGWSFYLILEKI